MRARNDENIVKSRKVSNTSWQIYNGQLKVGETNAATNHKIKRNSKPSEDLIQLDEHEENISNDKFGQKTHIQQVNE